VYDGKEASDTTVVTTLGIDEMHADSIIRDELHVVEHNMYQEAPKLVTDRVKKIDLAQKPRG